MEDVIRIEGIVGGQFALANYGAPLAVNIGPGNTLRLGTALDADGRNDFPITLTTRNLKGALDIRDSSGRLLLSWASSEDLEARPLLDESAVNSERIPSDSERQDWQPTVTSRDGAVYY